jgi:hypothetical protein
MNMPPADHPVWKTIRLLVVGFVLVICCSWLYKNGFDRKDIITIAVTILSLGGFDQLKAALTKEEEKDG